MLATIHEHLSVPVNGLHEDEDMRWRLDETERVRLGSWSSHRKTLQLRIVLRLEEAHSPEGLGTHGQRFSLRQQLLDVDNAGAAQPHTIQVRLTVRFARRRTARRLRGDAAACARLRRRG